MSRKLCNEILKALGVDTSNVVSATIHLDPAAAVHITLDTVVLGQHDEFGEVKHIVKDFDLVERK